MLKIFKKLADKNALREIERLKLDIELLGQICAIDCEIQNHYFELARNARGSDEKLNAQIATLKKDLSIAQDRAARVRDLENRTKESYDSLLKQKLKEAEDRWKSAIAKVMRMDLQQLKGYSCFTVSPDIPGLEGEHNDEVYDAIVKQANESGTLKWIVYHNICSLGGCDFNGEEFPSEIEAYRAAAILTVLYGCPDSSTACSSCYQEYVKECI